MTPSQRTHLQRLSPAVLSYLFVIVVAVLAVAPFLELRGRYILTADFDYANVHMFYDAFSTWNWLQLPPPAPFVYFEGQNIIYAMAVHIYEPIRALFTTPASFRDATIVTVGIVNAIAHVLAALVFFSTARLLSRNVVVAALLTALFAWSPQLLDIEIFRIDRLMLLPLAVLLHMSVRITRLEAGWREGAMLGLAMAVLSATKLTGILFGAFPGTALLAVIFAHPDRSRVWRCVRTVVIAALAVGLPALAILMIRYVLDAGHFIAVVRAGYEQQIRWNSVLPFTPRLYYNVELFKGYGPVFLVAVVIASGVTLYRGFSRRDITALWVFFNLAIFSIAGVFLIKYERGGYHLIPLYLYALAIAFSHLQEAIPRLTLTYSRAIGVAVMLFPLTWVTVAYAQSAHVGWRKEKAMDQTRFAARDWLAANLPAGSRICMMSDTEWANPQLDGLGFQVTSQLLTIPFLSAPDMRELLPPRLFQVRAACDALVFNDAHLKLYIDTFRLQGSEQRAREWEDFLEALKRAYPPHVFTSKTTVFYVKKVEVYDLRHDPAVDPGQWGQPVRADASLMLDGNTLRVGAASFAITPAALVGATDSAIRYRDVVHVRGWAADVRQLEPAMNIAVVADDRVVAIGSTGTVRRPDVAKVLQQPLFQLTGYSLCIPVAALGSADSIKILALSSDGMATFAPESVAITDAAANENAPAECRDMMSANAS